MQTHVVEEELLPLFLGERSESDPAPSRWHGCSAAPGGSILRRTPGVRGGSTAPALRGLPPKARGAGEFCTAHSAHAARHCAARRCRSLLTALPRPPCRPSLSPSTPLWWLAGILRKHVTPCDVSKKPCLVPFSISHPGMPICCTYTGHSQKHFQRTRAGTARARVQSSASGSKHAIPSLLVKIGWAFAMMSKMCSVRDVSTAVQTTGTEKRFRCWGIVKRLSQI